MAKRPNYLQCSGEEWEKQRMRTLVRDDFICQFHALNLNPIEGVCTHEHPVTRLRELQIHHIQQRINGGTHDLDNLLTVCYAHHVQIHPHMRFELRADERGFELALREL